MHTGNKILSRNGAEGRSYHHGDLRAALVTAGNELLREQGYEAMSLRAVAARAQVSHSAPYNHFRDRRALLAAIASDGFRTLLAAITGAPAHDPAHGLTEAGRAYLRFAHEHTASYRLMFTSDILVGNPDPEIGQVSIATYHALQARVEALLPGHRNPGAVASVYWSQLHGLALLLQENRIRPWMRDGATDAELAEALLAGLPASVAAAATALG